MSIAKMINEKKHYRQYRARTEKLPENYRGAIRALERYFMYFGPGKGDELLVMLDDLAELFDESVADGTTLQDIVGDDPVEFAETFRQNYPAGQWIVRERARLVEAIENCKAIEDSTRKET